MNQDHGTERRKSDWTMPILAAVILGLLSYIFTSALSNQHQTDATQDARIAKQEAITQQLSETTALLSQIVEEDHKTLQTKR